jgi:hypothetical protein
MVAGPHPGRSAVAARCRWRSPMRRRRTGGRPTTYGESRHLVGELQRPCGDRAPAAGVRDECERLVERQRGVMVSRQPLAPRHRRRGSPALDFHVRPQRQRVELGLGSGRDLPLASARGEAAELRGEARRRRRSKGRAREGQDRANLRRIRRCYVAAMTPSWGNSKHAKQWKMTLTTYAAPISPPAGRRDPHR